MASVTKYRKKSKRTGNVIEGYRAFVRRTVNGKSVGASKIFPTRAEAKEWARQQEAPDALKNLANAGSASGTIAELVTLFQKAPPAKGWKFADPDHLEWWAAKLGHQKPSEVDHGTINQLKAELQAKPAMRHGKGGPKATGNPISAATVNRYLASLSSLFNFALARKIVDRHPMKGGNVSKERELNQRTRTLTPEEEQRLYSAAEQSSWPMLRLFLRLCLTTGCRRSEALKLQWTDLRLDQSHALLHRTKNGKPRVMPLVEDVVEDLRAAEGGKGASRFVFADPSDPRRPKNINTPWRHCRKAAGLLEDREDPLDRVYLHSTRHTVSTRLIRSGASLAATASITGHLTVAALTRYVHLDSQHSIDLAQRVLGKAR